MLNNYWGETTSKLVHIINICPTKNPMRKIPYKAWEGVKLSVIHFIIFGSLYFRHVPKKLRRKLDVKSKIMILIGYHSTGAYKSSHLLRVRW